MAGEVIAQMVRTRILIRANTTAGQKFLSAGSISANKGGAPVSRMAISAVIEVAMI